MYPPTARQIAFKADPLIDALRQHGLLVAPVQRVAVEITLSGPPSIMLWHSEQLDDHLFACPAPIYQALYPIFTQAPRGASTPFDTLLLEAGSQTIALVDRASLSAWLTTPAPAPVLLASHRSDHVVPLDGLFDATAVIYGGATPAGVRVVAIIQDEFSNVLVVTHPTDAGTVVQDAAVQPTLLGLLQAARDVNGVAVICDLRSQRLFAVSRPAMISILARQQIPNLEPPMLERMTAYAPTFITDAAMHARAWAIGGDTFRRVFATVLFGVCAALTVACGWFWYAAGVYPLIWTATRIFTGTDLDAVDRTIVFSTAATSVVSGGVAGLAAIRLLACVPSLLEFVGVMFSAFRWMQQVLLFVAAIDVAGNTFYYFMHFYPHVEAKSPAMQVLLIASTFIGALMGGTVAAIGFEPLTIILLVMTVALAPVVPWALRSSIEGVALLALRVYYGAAGIGDTVSTQHAILRAEANTEHVLYVHGAPPARRSLFAIIQTFGTLALIVGIGFVVVYMLLLQGR